MNQDSDQTNPWSEFLHLRATQLARGGFPIPYRSQTESLCETWEKPAWGATPEEIVGSDTSLFSGSPPRRFSSDPRSCRRPAPWLLNWWDQNAPRAEENVNTLQTFPDYTSSSAPPTTTESKNEPATLRVGNAQSRALLKTTKTKMKYWFLHGAEIPDRLPYNIQIQ